MAHLPSSSSSHQILREHGLQPSKTRVAIYEWLAQHPVHPTVDVVYHALRKTHPTLSRTTVYNVLHAFVDRGLADKVHTEDLELRYDGNTASHAHFKCTKCGTLIDLNAVPTSVSKKVGLPEGYLTHTTSITLWGLCPKCAPKMMRRPKA
jgi:Fe2+ or Zn2+ uptake regulation protein